MSDKNELEKRLTGQFIELGYKVTQFWFNYGPENEILGFGVGVEKNNRKFIYDSAVPGFTEY